MAGFPVAATIVAVDPPAAAPDPRAGRRAVTAPAAAAPAAAASAAPAAKAIQIGPDKHHYVYRHCDNWSSEVYRCDRGSQWGTMGERLFLFMNADGPGP